MNFWLESKSPPLTWSIIRLYLVVILSSFVAANDTESMRIKILNQIEEWGYDRQYKEFHFVVTSRPEYPLNFTEDQLEQLDKTNILEDSVFEDSFFAYVDFIQQALYIAHEEAPIYSLVKVHVWLSRGNHFLIQCDEFVDFEQTQNSQMNALCSLQTMQKFMPITDNVIFEFKAIDCLDKDVKAAWENDELYESLCSYIPKSSKHTVQD